jgi:ribosomal protein S10
MILSLKIKSLDKITFQLYIIFLKSIFKILNLSTDNIKSLPIKKKRINLLKSPHVNKKAQEHFELRIYRGILKINLNGSDMMHLIRFLAVNKPKNVKVTFLLQSYLN